MIPQELRTEELYHLAVQENGYVLADVPKKLRAEEICRLAIRRQGSALNYVPGELREKEMCRLAVQQDGMALKYVPERYCGQRNCAASRFVNVGMPSNMYQKNCKRKKCITFCAPPAQKWIGA